MATQKFVEKKAYELYVKAPLVKSLIKIIATGVMISLMMGIYVFIDQILIATLIPYDGVHDFKHIFSDIGATEEQIKQYIDHKTTFFSAEDVLKSAISISSPITVCLTSLPFFVATGTSIVYTQSLGKNFKDKGHQIWKTGFWLAICVGLTITIVLLSAGKTLLTTMAGKQIHLTSGDHIDILNAYYAKVHSLQIEYAYQFIIVITCGACIPCLVNLLSALIRSEGRLLYPTLTTLFSNVFNVVIDIILIWYAKMGMISGSIATLLGWSINFLCLVGYINYNNIKKKATWLQFKVLLPFNGVKFNWKFVPPIVLLGISGFITDFTYSIAMMVYLPILSETSSAISAHDGEYWMSISGGVLPIINLLFSASWGVVDGTRPFDSYNYSIANFKRIKKAYWMLLVISFTFTLMCVALGSALGYPILWLFQINPDRMNNAYIYLIIDLFMLPAFSFQISGILLFQGTNDVFRANLFSILQDVVVYYPVLFIMRYITLQTGNIWVLISTYITSAFLASMLMVGYCSWYVINRFGKTKFIYYQNNKRKVGYAPTSIIRMSLAEKALLADSSI